MTDLEITTLCAEAMGYVIASDGKATNLVLMVEIPHHAMLPRYAEQYDPLHDDAQAMALVKKLKISVAYLQDYVSGDFFWYCNHQMNSQTRSPDLNRAICECVAKMENARP